MQTARQGVGSPPWVGASITLVSAEFVYFGWWCGAHERGDAMESIPRRRRV